MQIRLLQIQEFSMWDKLIDLSPQATVFHSILWQDILEESQGERPSLYVCERKREFLGGLAVRGRKSRQASGHVQLDFNGPVFHQSLLSEGKQKTAPMFEVLSQLLTTVVVNFPGTAFKNQPEIWDARAYGFNGWQVTSSYTHRMPISLMEAKTASADDFLLDNQASNSEVSDAKLSSYCSFLEANNSAVHVLKKQMRLILQAGIGRMLTLYNKAGEEVAFAFAIMDKPRRLLYLKQIYTLNSDKHHVSIMALISKCCQEFSSEFDVIDLDESSTQSISKTKDALGAILTPFFRARYL
jgi:hypothetical protein